MQVRTTQVSQLMQEEEAQAELLGFRKLTGL